PVIYYRLKQVDFNGNYSYSDIRAIMSQAKPVFEIVTVQPNPFMDKFTLNYASSTSADVSVEITDMFGKTIHSGTLTTQKGINTFELSETINMKGGVYFVRLIQNDEVRIVRVVKQN